MRRLVFDNKKITNSVQCLLELGIVRLVENERRLCPSALLYVPAWYGMVGSGDSTAAPRTIPGAAVS